MRKAGRGRVDGNPLIFRDVPPPTQLAVQRKCGPVVSTTVGIITGTTAAITLAILILILILILLLFLLLLLLLLLLLVLLVLLLLPSGRALPFAFSGEALPFGRGSSFFLLVGELFLLGRAPPFSF